MCAVVCDEICVLVEGRVRCCRKRRGVRADGKTSEARRSGQNAGAGPSQSSLVEASSCLFGGRVSLERGG